LTGTPTAPTAAVTTDNTQIATTAFVRDIIPTGLISLWSGSVASIPSGWFLCDGSNGTPDLRNRFIVGAGSTYAVGATGGSANATLVSHTHTFSGNTGAMNANQAHTHGVSDPGHNHQGGPGGAASGNFGGWFSNADFTIDRLTSTSATNISINATNIDHLHAYSGTTSTSGSSATNANLPPYYALAYIMKS
jgi:microcystin-dependent protein